MQTGDQIQLYMCMSNHKHAEFSITQVELRKISKVKMTFIVHIVALSEEENKVEINEFLLFLHLLFFKSTRFDLKKKQPVFLSLE